MSDGQERAEIPSPRAQVLSAAEQELSRIYCDADNPTQALHGFSKGWERPGVGDVQPNALAWFGDSEVWRTASRRDGEGYEEVVQLPLAYGLKPNGDAIEWAPTKVR